MSSISCKVARSLGAGLTAAGFACLDAHELSFSTSGVLGPLMRSKSFRVALDGIASLSWSTRSSTLRIQTDAGPPFTLQGTGSVRLLVAMSAMDVGRRRPEEGARVGRLHAECAATLAVGPVYYRGHLALGSGGLFWECTGSVEQLVGIAGIRLPLHAVVGARAESTGMTLLALDGAEHRLLLDRPEPLIHLLFELVREHAPDRPAGTAPGEGGGDAERPVVCFDATLRELDAPLTAQGSVSARADGTISAAWPGGEPRFIDPVHVQRLAYGEPDPDAAPEMVLTTTAGTQLRVTPSDGWNPIEELFALSRSLPLLSMVPPAQHPLLSRAVGELASVTSDTARVERLALRPAVLLHLADAVGVVLPGRVEWKVAVGTRVRLQIGLPRALLMISGRFMGCAHRSRAEGLPGWPAATESAHVAQIAILDESSVERIATRRETFRVTTVDEQMVREMERRPGRGVRPVGPRIPCRLCNMSLGGCGLLLREARPVGTLFQLVLDLDDGELVLHLQVVYAAPMRQDDGRWWRHGTQVQEPSSLDRTRLAQEVRRREVNPSLLDA